MTGRPEFLALTVRGMETSRSGSERFTQWTFNLSTQIRQLQTEEWSLSSVARVRLDLDWQPLVDIPFAPDLVPVPLTVGAELAALRERIRDLEGQLNSYRCDSRVPCRAAQRQMEDEANA